MPTNVASECILGHFVPRCVGGLRYRPSIVGVSSCCLPGAAAALPAAGWTLGTSLAALQFAETSPGVSGLAPPSLSARLRSSTAALQAVAGIFSGPACVSRRVGVCVWMLSGVFLPPGALLDRVPPSAAWC